MILINRNHLKHLTTTVFILVCMMGHPFSSVSFAQTKQPVIQINKGKMTAYVNNLPLIDVLESIADQTGMGFELYGKEERRVTIKYTDIPLVDGLKRTLRPYNHIILYSKKRSQSRKPEILKVIVYDQAGKNSGQAVRRDPLVLETREHEVRNDRVSSSLPNDSVDDSGDNSGEKVSLKEYAKQLKDPDPDVREEAISDMADEYEAEALIYLEMALIHDGNSDVRSAAAEEIGDLENVLGIDILARGLKDPDEDVREAVVGALGNIGGRGTLPVLRRALKDRNEDIREEAADLIEEIEEELAN